MSPETSPVPRLHKCTFVSYKEIHLKLQELCFRVRERSAESGGEKSTGFTAGPQAPQRPHPIPPLAPSTSGMSSSSTLRPHTGSPRFPEDLKGNHGPPHLCPTPPRRGMQRDVSRPHAGHFATLLPEPQIAQWSGSFSVPPRVPIAGACPLPVQHRNPEAIAGDRAAPHLPGPGA